MPTLKQLRCELEWGSTKTPFPEYATTYGDGLVETYIAIPDHPQPFAVHLTSKGYIAEGLAMLIFMDGEYQCNRNRLNLQLPGPQTPRNMTEIDLRVRQKEKPLGDGTYLGRGWRFDKHNIVPVDQLPSNVDRQHFHEIGAICVFVLRCRAKEQVEKGSTTSSEVDDSGLQPSEPPEESPKESPKESPTEEYVSSDTVNPEEAETEPETLLGFMNDGTADKHQFGLDGEGPGPTEQRAWSWPAPQPSHPAGHGQQGAYTAGQLPPAQTQPYGNYGYPVGFPQSGPSGPTPGQEQGTTHRPQRHVHFNDQIPHQPSGYGAPGPRPSGPNFGTNIGQFHTPEYTQQPGNYAAVPQGDYTHHAPNHGPASHGYANPSMIQSGMAPTAQDHGTAFAAGAQPGYPPPVPSYQPIGYGVSGYTGWPPVLNHLAYAQSAWPAHSMPGPSYLTPPGHAPAYQASYPYPYPQPTFSVGPVAPAPHLGGNHPGGGIWGPPPQKAGSLDPAKDENNQLDGQGNQDQDNIDNATGQSNDNNDQGWDNDANKTQAGDSGWNSHDTGGAQNDNWNSTAIQTEAQTNDWNQSAVNTDRTNYANSTWNTTANTSTQVQDSWNAAPGPGQQDAETVTLPQHASTATMLSAQDRPLYGPHGAYLQTVSTSTNGGLQPDAGEERPYDVPADMPTTHQVKPGEGYMYVHKRRSPEYLDTLEEPYARFIFKYRTKEQIEKETGIRIEDEPTGDEEKRKLQVMEKDEIIEMLLRAKIALGGNVPSPEPTLPPKPEEYNNGNNQATAVPAPAYKFLGYSFPKSRTNSHIPPSEAGNVGLGVSIPASPAAAATTAQNWAGNNSWGNASVASAATAPTVETSAQQPQPQTTDTWSAPAAPAQPPAQPPTQIQAQFQAQPQSQPQTQPQIQQQSPIAPLQFNPTVQTYQPPSDRGAPTVVLHQPAFAANGRPITPPHGGWGAHTAASSSVSDNGMARWNVTGTAGGGDGGGWGGEAATSQPSGNW